LTIKSIRAILFEIREEEVLKVGNFEILINYYNGSLSNDLIEELSSQVKQNDYSMANAAIIRLKSKKRFFRNKNKNFSEK
jgi:hypothetical protein